KTTSLSRDLAMDRLENRPAFAHLSVLVDIAPDLKDIIKHKFITCLCRLSVIYKRLGYNEESQHFVMKALDINQFYLPAITNIQIVNSRFVERWHFRIYEAMDAGLFGEHFLTTLKHAWDKLLLPPKSKFKPELPNGCVIPHHATVYAVPIQCSYIRKKNLFYVKEQLYFKQFNLCFTTNEPYDCEKLNQLPGDCVFIASPQVVIHVNFNDPNQINKLLNRILDTCRFPIFGIEILSLTTSSTNSYIDVEIYYIDINLTEVLNNFKYSNIFCFDKNKMKKFDVIISEKRKMLKPNRIILPKKISIKCQLINSKWLPHVSKVIENNDSCNLHIRDLINAYGVNHHLDLFKHLVTDICLSDSNENPYVYQCAFLVENTINVNKGKEVKINTTINNGHLLLSVDKI
ncbi:protein arginine N-methyltransferase 9-like, partial [Aphis craccivora]